MSGNATTERVVNGLQLFIRLGMAGFLYVHCIGLLMAIWQSVQIIGLGESAVLLPTAAIPMMFFIGAVMLAIGFKTRFTAIAMIVLLAGTTLFALASSGSLGIGALTGPLRLTVILLLLQLVILGPGRWSVDGLIAARVAARAAQ